MGRKGNNGVSEEKRNISGQLIEIEGKIIAMCARDERGPRFRANPGDLRV